MRIALTNPTHRKHAKGIAATCAAFAVCVLPLAAQEAPVAAAEAPVTAEAPAASPIQANSGDPVAQSLLANSPFMSKAFRERIAKSEGNRTRDLSFRGFAGNGDSWLICVYNSQSRQSEWVELGSKVNDITIAEFDKEQLRIRVVKDSTSIYLELEQPNK